MPENPIMEDLMSEAGLATSTGLEPAYSTLTGWRTGQIVLRRHRSGERIRTAITWVTTTGPAVRRHRNGLSWRGSDLNRRSTAYEAVGDGRTPLPRCSPTGS